MDGCVSTTINNDGCQMPLCVGCGLPIQDQYILRVVPNLEWHAGCLKCAECGQFLDESCTCFVRNRKTYCKRDYNKLFGAKCDKCRILFKKNDLVMRAKDKLYHVKCFHCVTCSQHLIPGDEFVLRDDQIYCKTHDIYSPGDVIGGNPDPHMMSGFGSPGAPVVMSPTSMHGVQHPMRTHSGVCVSTPPSGRSSGSGQKRKDAKTTRVRTVLNEKQLHTLRTCYAANCRPDALMKEQLTEMTGLSARVIRVWFQNKRCKDKKRSIAMKQLQENVKQQNNTEKNGNSAVNQVMTSINGIPMVVSEPVKNEPPNPKPIEVQNYQQPAWKALSDFALQSEIEQPGFQHLMTNFSDHGQGSLSDSSEIRSIPSVSSSGVDISVSCSTPLAMPPHVEANSASACS